MSWWYVKFKYNAKERERQGTGLSDAPISVQPYFCSFAVDLNVDALESVHMYFRL